MANINVRRRVVGFVKTKKRRRPVVPERRRSEAEDTIIGGPAKPMTPLAMPTTTLQAQAPWWKAALLPVGILVAMLLCFWLAASVVRRPSSAELPRNPPPVRDSPARHYGQYGASMPGGKAQPTEESFLASHRGTGGAQTSVASAGPNPPVVVRSQGRCVVATGSALTSENILAQLGNCLAGPQ